MTKYLLVSHVPFGRTAAPDRFLIGDLWLEDLRAQTASLREQGVRLVLAAPLMDELNVALTGSFNVVELSPAEVGFEYERLPFYISMKQFLQTKSRTIARLAEVMRDADIVQVGYGGHPVALGEIALPLAKRMNKKVIWVFDGADPFPRLELHARQQRNPIKRWLQSTLVRRFQRTCRDAVRECDLVFAHNIAVVERFRDVWDPKRCYHFDRSFVTDEILLSDAQLGERQRWLTDTAQPLRLIAAGRQIAIKGTDHVLRALKQARDRNVPVELDIIGEGDDLPQFKRLANDLRLDGAVRFGGTMPYGKPLFDEWSKAHVMVITNLTAEISRNVLLSMARGLPLVMYANPGTDELIKASGAGVLVPTGDVDGLARAFEQMARDRSTLPQMAAGGLRMARQKTLDATHRERAALAADLVRRQPAVVQPVASALASGVAR